MAVLGCLTIKVKTSIAAVALRLERNLTTADGRSCQMFAAAQCQRDRTNAHVGGCAILHAVCDLMESCSCSDGATAANGLSTVVRAAALADVLESREGAGVRTQARRRQARAVTLLA